MEKNNKNGCLTLTKLEEKRVDVILNPGDHVRGLTRHKVFGPKRSQSTGNLRETQQIGPNSSRYCAGSPYMNTR